MNYNNQGFNINPIPTGVESLKNTSINQDTPQGTKYVYESPLSVLETIRTVSNIIVGATKSFDRVNNYFSQLEQSQAPVPEEVTLIPPLGTTGENM